MARPPKCQFSVILFSSSARLSLTISSWKTSLGPFQTSVTPLSLRIDIATPYVLIHRCSMTGAPLSFPFLPQFTLPSSSFMTLQASSPPLWPSASFRPLLATRVKSLLAASRFFHVLAHTRNDGIWVVSQETWSGTGGKGRSIAFLQYNDKKSNV